MFKTTTVVSKGASVEDITQAIIDATPRATMQAAKFAHLLQGQNTQATLYNVWRLLQSLKYVPDGYAHQKIQLPSKLMHTKSGDCKSYALFTAAVCNVLNIPCQYVVTTYGSPTDAHIYCISGNTVIDGTLPNYNQEAPNYTTRKLYNTMTKVSVMGQASVNGLLENSWQKAQSLIVKNLVAFTNNKTLVKNTRKLALGEPPFTTISNSARLFFTGVRFMILVAFRNNLAGIATAYKNMGAEDRKVIDNLFVALGGSKIKALIPAIRSGYAQPVLQVSDATAWLRTKAAQLKGQQQYTGDIKQVFNWATMNGDPTTDAGIVSAITAVGSIVTFVLTWAKENPDLASDILDKTKKDTNTGGGEGPEGGAVENNSSTNFLPLAALAALALT